MAAPTSVVNKTGDHEEIVERLSKWLGTDKLRRKLFNSIYGRSRTARSLKQIMADAGIKERDRQQAQNQIEHLYKRHLISREDNERAVSDGVFTFIPRTRPSERCAKRSSNMLTSRR
jgi:hypothetical protein